jgi:hypothetical protein
MQKHFHGRLQNEQVRIGVEAPGKRTGIAGVARQDWTEDQMLGRRVYIGLNNIKLEINKYAIRRRALSSFGPRG